MDLTQACQKAGLLVEEGQKIINTLNKSITQKTGKSFTTLLTTVSGKDQWIEFGLLIRDICRGLPNDQLTILFTNFILPQYYKALNQKVDKMEMLKILTEIDKKEQCNSRAWTLKNLKTQVFDQDAVFNKSKVLSDNNSLQLDYNITINQDKTFNFTKDGKLIKTTKALFLGSIDIINGKCYWHWIDAIGQIPPIDLEMIITLLPSIFTTPTVEVSSSDLSILLSILAILFGLSEVQLIQAQIDKKGQLCVGLV